MLGTLAIADTMLGDQETQGGGGLGGNHEMGMNFGSWLYSDYPYRYALLVNNSGTVASNKTNEFLAWDLSSISGLCNSNCTNIRVTALDPTGAEVEHPYNATGNWTNGTGLPAGWITPTAGNPLYLFTVFNSTISTDWQVAGYVYLNASDVYDWFSPFEIYATNFCDIQGWTINAGTQNTSNRCGWNDINNLNVNYVYTGQQGGFVTTERHYPGTTRGAPALAITNVNDNYFYTADEIAGNNAIWKDAGGGGTKLGGNNGTGIDPTWTKIVTGISWYPLTGTTPINAYAVNFSPNESYLLDSLYATHNNDTTKTGLNSGFAGITGGWEHDFCYVYYPNDTNLYCRLYAMENASSESEQSSSIQIYSPANATISNLITVTYYAANQTNPTFPCNTTLDTINIYNEMHTSETNTTFAWTTTAGFHNLTVTCGGSPASVFFTAATGLWAALFDETNQQAILGNLTISNSSSSTTTGIAHNFTLDYSSIPQGSITITAHNDSYYDRTFYTTNDQYSLTNLSIYLVPQGTNSIYVGFHVNDITNIPIANATVNIQRQFTPGVWTTVGQEKTDGSGSAWFYMTLNQQYGIQVIASGYTLYFATATIGSNTYTIYLTKTNSYSGLPNTALNCIEWYLSPYNRVLTANETTNITFSIAQSTWNFTNCTLVSYYMNITLDNGTQLFYANGSYPGGTLTYAFNGTQYPNNNNVSVETSFTSDIDPTNFTTFDLFNTYWIYGQINTFGQSLTDFTTSYANSGMSNTGFAIIGLFITLLVVIWVSHYSSTGAFIIGAIILGWMQSIGHWLDITVQTSTTTSFTITGWAVVALTVGIVAAILYLRQAR